MNDTSRRRDRGNALAHGAAAAGLSIVFGVGFAHAALRRPIRGGVFLALLLGAVAGISQTIWCVPLVGAIAAVGMIDAFVLAYRSRDPHPFHFRHAAVFAFPLVVIVGLMAMRRTVIENFNVVSSSMSPTLDVGDRFFVEKLGEPQVGDVITFHAPCTDRTYVMRLIARGGDTVEVRCGVVFINNKALERKLVERADTCSYMDYDSRDGQWFRRGCSRYRETVGDHTHDVFDDPERPELDAANQGDRNDFPVRDGEGPICIWTGAPMALDADHWKLVETKPAGSAGACNQQLHFVVPRDHVFVLGDSRHNAADSRIWGALPKSSITGRAVGIWVSKPGGHSTFSRFGPVH